MAPINGALPTLPTQPLFPALGVLVQGRAGLALGHLAWFRTVLGTVRPGGSTRLGSWVIKKIYFLALGHLGTQLPLKSPAGSVLARLFCGTAPSFSLA